MSVYTRSDELLSLSLLLDQYRVAVNGTREALELKVLAAIEREALFGRLEVIERILTLDKIDSKVTIRAIDTLARSHFKAERLAEFAKESGLKPAVRAKLFDVLAEKGMLLTLLDIYGHERDGMERILKRRLESAIERCATLCEARNHTTTLDRAVGNPLASEVNALTSFVRRREREQRIAGRQPRPSQRALAVAG